MRVLIPNIVVATMSLLVMMHSLQGVVHVVGELVLVGEVKPAVGEERRMKLVDKRAVVAGDLYSQAEGCIVP